MGTRVSRDWSIMFDCMGTTGQMNKSLRTSSWVHLRGGTNSSSFKRSRCSLILNSSHKFSACWPVRKMLVCTLFCLGVCAVWSRKSWSVNTPLAITKWMFVWTWAHASSSLVCKLCVLAYTLVMWLHWGWYVSVWRRTGSQGCHAAMVFDQNSKYAHGASSHERGKEEVCTARCR